MKKNNSILINPNSIVRFLAAVALLLVLVSIVSQSAFYISGNSIYDIQFFNVDEEVNIPTLFSTFILLFAAFLLTVIVLLERKQENSDILYWSILSLGFLYMSVDESLAIHENIGAGLQRMLNTHGMLYYAWIIPGIIIILVLALFFFRFFFRLSIKTRIFFYFSNPICRWGNCCRGI